MLAGQYLDVIHLGCEESADNQEELKEACFRFSSRLYVIQSMYEERKQAWHQLSMTAMT
jgi:hypothetical protein